MNEYYPDTSVFKTQRERKFVGDCGTRNYIILVINYSWTSAKSVFHFIFPLIFSPNDAAVGCF